jgi:dephospho-CoA kinase
MKKSFRNSTTDHKIILGLVGEIASGKDTVAAYLNKKHHSQTISFSKPLRDILDRIFLPQTRENLAWLGYDLRQRFGQDVLAKTITQEAIKNKSNIVVLPNVRLPQDIKYFKKMPGFYLVAIEAEAKTRYQRLIKRSQNADDKSKSWQQFLKDAKLPTETSIRKIARQSKYKIDNNGDFKNLYQQIESLIQKAKNINNE